MSLLLSTFSTSFGDRDDDAFLVAFSLLASGAISAGKAAVRAGSCSRATAATGDRIVVDRRSKALYRLRLREKRERKNQKAKRKDERRVLM